MELYFFRHGDAGPAAVGTPDEARRLTERGRRETDAVAQVLHRVGLAPEVILTSPLTRARETGEILAKVFGLSPQADDRLRPGCQLGAIQDLASDHPHQRLLLVGHEPDFSTTVGQLIGRARVQMKKSGLAYVQAERIEPGQGVLIWLISPALLPGQ